MELVNKVLQGYVDGELKDIAPSTRQDNVFLSTNQEQNIDSILQKANTQVQSVNGITGPNISFPTLKIYINTMLTPDVPPATATDVVVGLPLEYTQIKAIIPFALLPNAEWESFATVYQVFTETNTVQLLGHNGTQNYNMQYAVLYE